MSRSKRHVKQSKPKQTRQTPPAVEVEPVVVTYEQTAPFADVEDFEVGVADERQLRLLIKDWRKGRATQTIWGMITDGYVMVFSLVVIVAMLISGLRNVQQSAAGCTDATCVTSRHMLPWFVLAACVLCCLALARLFGPVIASAAEGFWLLDAPLRRSILLRSRLYFVVGLAFVAGGVLTALLLMPTGLAIDAIVIWAGGVGAVCAAAISFSALTQAYEKYRIHKLIQGVVALICFGLLIVMVGIRLGWWTYNTDPELISTHGRIVLIVGVIALIAGLALAARSLHSLRRARLVSGGDLLSGMQGAAFALDFGLMRDIVVERRWYAKGFVKPARGGGVGRNPLVWRDLRRLKRSPLRLTILVATAVLPYALLSMGAGNFTWPVTAIVLMFAMIPLFDSLRVLSRTKGLARCLPLSTADITSSLTILPLLVTAIWAILASPALIVISREGLDPQILFDSIVCAIITGIAAVIGAIRWVTAKSADYNKPMVATGFGALPPGLAFNMVRGFDVIALITLPILLGWNYWISIVIAMICYLVLRSGGIDSEEMMERNKEAREELERMRSGKGSRSKEKIVYERSRRR